MRLDEYLDIVGGYITFNSANYYWEKADLLVIYDGYCPVTGKSYRIVREDLEQCEIDNVIVVGMVQYKLYRFK